MDKCDRDVLRELRKYPETYWPGDPTAYADIDPVFFGTGGGENRPRAVVDAGPLLLDPRSFIHQTY